MPVKQQDDNCWEIKNAVNLYKLTYNVEDTWDSEIKNRVYTMCGTNFEAGKNFVLNTCGIFGYFEGMKKNGFALSFKKPLNFYAATGLKPVSSSATNDIFHCSTADELYDSPIMFSLPDTASVRVGNADVLIAVYSPNKKASAKFLASHLVKLMMATKDYLGGKLPVDKYAFIYYMNGEQKKLGTTGAWEHSYSSFYSLEEEPEKEAIDNWVDISAHEFFHIVTPLTISSKEVKEFNFNETVLSKHLWLYEGSTEYYAHHTQVWAGLTTPEKFLSTLAQQLSYSRTNFNDSLSFTEMSKESAGKYADQYVNVYMKGSLISACIDLYLLKLSGGQYALKDLKHDLGVKYGKDNYFNDDELFDAIEKLTWPEIKNFLVTYVEGSKPIPYEQFFEMAGVKYLPKETFMEFTIGGIGMENDSLGRIIVHTENMNEVGRKLGYLENDELASINGEAVTASNKNALIDKFYATAKPGDKLTVTVRRKDASGKYEPVTLSAAAEKVAKIRWHQLKFDDNATAAQLKLRNTWLGNHTVEKKAKADSADVKEIDGIINALYTVISGPAGERDWNRFRSLFHKDAFMGAMTPKREFRKFSPEEYIQRNSPYFLKNAFNEKEIGRTVNQFGNIAQVFTAYEYTAGNTNPKKQRGINSVELVNEQGRWWIMSVSWEEETSSLPLPSKIIDNNKATK